jgi:site-specific DNA-methyltransferase (adenine-specific)
MTTNYNPRPLEWRVRRLLTVQEAMMELDKIYCGDNCELLGQLPRECIDLVVTSPPYDDLRTYGGHSWDFFGVAWQLKRVIKMGGVIVWVVADATHDGSETGSSMEQALHFKRLGLNLHDTMIYETAKPPLTHNRYEQAFEFAFILSAGKPKAWNPIKDACAYAGTKTKATYRESDDRLRNRNGKQEINETKIKGNIWRYRSGFGSDDATKHPAQFPLALAKDHISSWSNPGDLVLDPFSGSGTTAKAAKELGRRFIGFEINPEYCAIAERRLAQQVLDFEDA